MKMTNITYEWLATILFFSSAVLANLYLSEKKVIKSVGDIGSVRCSSDSKNAAWVNINGKDRFSVKESDGGSLLEFKNLTLQDTGKYTCKSGSDKEDFILIVQGNLELSHYRMHKKENESGTVVCSHKKGENVTWSNIEGRERFQIRPRGLNSSQLVFEGVTLKDSGKYTCRGGQEKEDFILSVYEPLEFIDTRSPQKGKLHNDFTLRCEVTGSGATISWEVNGKSEYVKERIQKIADGLLIRSLTREDSDSNYTCTAIRVVTGDVIRKNIELIVEHKPIPVYQKSIPEYAYIGGSKNLTCEVYAVPPPDEFKWTRGKKVITKNVINETSHKSILQINPVIEESYGDYVCSTKNSHGELKIDFTLHEYAQPEMPTSVNLLNTSSTSIYLQIVGPNQTEEYDGFHVQYKVVNSTNPQEYQVFDKTTDGYYVLHNLTSNTCYEVQVATLNKAGLSDFTNTTTIQTKSGSSSFYLLSSGYFSLVILLMSVTSSL